MTSNLSKRGDENVAGLYIPWRFAPSLKRYEKSSNPSGIILSSSAEIVRPILKTPL
jgi:hypothetical protein